MRGAPGGPAVTDRAVVGIVLMCLAVGIFPALNASVKYLQGVGYGIVEIIWARYAGHVLFMVLVFMPRLGWRLFVPRRPKVQLTRSLLLLTSTACYFTAIGFIPLTTAASIAFTAPFIITALSVPMLGERVGPRRWLAVAVGFVGAMIIIRPGATGAHWAMLLVLGSAASYSLYQILTRKIAGEDSAETTAMYGALVGLLLSSLWVPWQWQTPVGVHIWVFIGMGLWAGLGHFFVVKALEFAAASVLAPFGYLQLVGATIFGYVLFGDFPDIWTWVGAAIIVACGIYIAYRERRLTP